MARIKKVAPGPDPVELQEVNKVKPGGTIDLDFAGKIMVLRKSWLKATYQNIDRRVRCTGGFGCSPTTIGRAVFGVMLVDGE